METGFQKQAAPPLAARLWWLIFGRAGTAIGLLLVGAIWKSSAAGRSTVTSLRFVAQILIAVCGLTIIYCVARLLWRHYLAQARFQFLADVLLVTWVVWTTGNVGSPYAALYVVVIAVASLFLGPRGAMITSVGSAAAFTGCALLALGGFGPLSVHPVHGDAHANMIQSVGLLEVSFLVVGLLAGEPAPRQAR